MDLSEGAFFGKELPEMEVLYETVRFVLMSSTCCLAGDGLGKAQVYLKNWHDFGVALKC